MWWSWGIAPGHETDSKPSLEHAFIVTNGLNPVEQRSGKQAAHHDALQIESSTQLPSDGGDHGAERERASSVNPPLENSVETAC